MYCLVRLRSSPVQDLHTNDLEVFIYYIFKYICIYIHIHKHTYIHTHIYISIYTYFYVHILSSHCIMFMHCSVHVLTASTLKRVFPRCLDHWRTRDALQTSRWSVIAFLSLAILVPAIVSLALGCMLGQGGRMPLQRIREGGRGVCVFICFSIFIIIIFTQISSNC